MTPWSGIKVFYFEGSEGGSERCLETNEDGSLTYWESPNRYAAMRGAKFSSETVTVTEAKKRWPLYVTEIDNAVAESAKAQNSN